MNLVQSILSRKSKKRKSEKSPIQELTDLESRLVAGGSNNNGCNSDTVTEPTDKSTGFNE